MIKKFEQYHSINESTEEKINVNGKTIRSYKQINIDYKIEEVKNDLKELNEVKTWIKNTYPKFIDNLIQYLIKDNNYTADFNLVPEQNSNKDFTVIVGSIQDEQGNYTRDIDTILNILRENGVYDLSYVYMITERRGDIHIQIRL